MDKIAALIASTGLIGLVAWWFFGKREAEAVSATTRNGEQTVEITADGGYTPDTVVLKKGVPANIVFTRKDSSACLEQVVFPDFGISEKLPVGKPHTIKINPSEIGEHKYACGMNMFFGKVVVK